MQVIWISVLALLLAISSMQWGVSTGEELNGKALNRPQRQTSYDDSSDINWWLYIVYSLIGLCVFIAPCVMFGIIPCIAVCITCTANSSSRNTTTHMTTTQAVPYPKPQPYNYSYPQPVQTHGYYPPGPPATLQAQNNSDPQPVQTHGYYPPGPPATLQAQNNSDPQPVQTYGYYPPGPPAVKAHDDSRPPSYSTTQLGNPMPQPNIGFQTYH